MERARSAAAMVDNETKCEGLRRYDTCWYAIFPYPLALVSAHLTLRNVRAYGYSTNEEGPVASPARSVAGIEEESKEC